MAHSSLPPAAHRLTRGPLLKLLRDGHTSVDIIATASGIIRAGNKTICHMYQTPIMMSSNPSSSVVIVLGSLRKAVVITPDEANRTVKVAYFVIPGTARLTKRTTTLRHHHNAIVVEDANHDRLTINYDADHTIRATPPLRPQHATSTFRNLLRAINQLSLVHAAHEARCSRTDQTISHYNALLTRPPRLSKPPTVTALPQAVPTLHPPPPVTGTVVYLNIEASPVPPSCYITCTIGPQAKQRSSLRPPSTVRRTVTVPLEPTVSFPFALHSHAPIEASFTVLFQSLRIPLPSAVFDMLDFSVPAAGCTLDSSHLVLSLNKYLTADIPTPSPTTLRLQLPTPREPLPTGEFSTVLNAVYTVSTVQALHDTTAIAIHGPLHVITFVRAALLRRFLRSLDSITTTTNARKWKSSVLQNLDNWLPSLRNAQTALVNAKTFNQSIVDGHLEHLYDRAEQRVYQDAILSARTCYIQLRQRFENLCYMPES